MTALYMFLAAVCILGPLVALHEFGHYIVARLCGVKVQTYSIGFGPKLFAWTSKRSGIRYQIAAIPLGGYVKMLDGRQESVADELKSVAFNHQHPLKKIAIVAAGPVMNFLIAIGLFWVLFLLPSEQLNTRIGEIIDNSPAAASGLVVGDKIISIDSKSVNTWQQTAYALASKMGESTTIHIGVNRDGQVLQKTAKVLHFMQTKEHREPNDPLSSLGILPYQPIISPVVGEVLSDGAGALMGLKTGDVFTVIHGEPINDWLSATKIIQANPETMLDVTVMRQGKQVDLKLMPRGVKTQNGVVGQLGIRPQIDTDTLIPDEYRMTIQYGVGEAFTQATRRTYDLSMMTLDAMGKMITGLIGIENLSGPIAIADVSKTSFELGFQEVLSTAAIISLSLAVLNLLPIPVLDGGHLVFYTYEWIMGKSMNEAVQMAAFKAGALLLFCFMLLAISNDIMRFFG